MKNLFSVILLFLLFVNGLFSQELQIFKVEDFDLKGKVKSCLVITDYGRELFQFDEEGRLVSTVTQYNESDQDITYYKYEEGELVEKRMESYKDNILDVTTSMVNFFTVDTTAQRRVSEKIISYDKEFLEQQTYEYDNQERLMKITSSNADGVDDITLSYETNKDEETCSYFFNGIIEKSIRTSEKKSNTTKTKIVLTKEFVDGEPNKAVEEVFEGEGALVSRESFTYDLQKKRFASDKKMFYSYDTNGMLTKEVTQTSNSKSMKEYIYQFDDSLDKNWVRQIVTPGNSYTSRKIEYYPQEKTEDVPN
ncbi:hypothetical protein [Flagellimonas allohymeniacidonis]|uniref:YD repeat-containing protein n=1 Tax=Flagellimonas allohymeniacidonis TaxID=2517819 RepID=A0A4V2HSQ4_9FLAO|nr:hypothetical protein [Allomuricauda hymeniacidonis]TAI48640.1 hypothetical protein EW142_02235 [Allomuricauda hymeniacidonis]